MPERNMAAAVQKLNCCAQHIIPSSTSSRTTAMLQMREFIMCLFCKGFAKKCVPLVTVVYISDYAGISQSVHINSEYSVGIEILAGRLHIVTRYHGDTDFISETATPLSAIFCMAFYRRIIEFGRFVERYGNHTVHDALHASALN